MFHRVTVLYHFGFLKVIDIAEVRYIRELDLLRNLNLLGNPIQGMPDYRLSLLFRIQSLVELDRSKVSVEEKVMDNTVRNPRSKHLFL